MAEHPTEVRLSIQLLDESEYVDGCVIRMSLNPVGISASEPSVHAQFVDAVEILLAEVSCDPIFEIEQQCDGFDESAGDDQAA